MDELKKKRLEKGLATEIPDEYLKQNPAWGKYNKMLAEQIKYILFLEKRIQELEKGKK